MSTLRGIIIERALVKIRSHYPEKPHEWAELQLCRCLRNTEWHAFEDHELHEAMRELLSGEFGIG